MKFNTFKSLLLIAGLIIPIIAYTSGGHSKQTSPVLAHDIFGNGPEKALVLHSKMGDTTGFELVKLYLNTKRYTYVFADLRSYGQSKHIKGKYTVDEISADAFKLADYLKWKQFHVIGHSMSGMAVQRMAINDWRNDKRRLKSIVAISPVTADGFPADAKTRKFLWNLIHNQDLSEQGISTLTGQRLLPKWIKMKAKKHIATSQKKRQQPESAHPFI